MNVLIVTELDIEVCVNYSELCVNYISIQSWKRERKQQQKVQSDVSGEELGGGWGAGGEGGI